LDWQKNSKTKVKKFFFFIFMSSCPEINQIGQYGYKKSVILHTDFKMGQFIYVTTEAPSKRWSQTTRFLGIFFLKTLKGKSPENVCEIIT
jgi:hypothetical protein